MVASESLWKAKEQADFWDLLSVGSKSLKVVLFHQNIYKVWQFLAVVVAVTKHYFTERDSTTAQGVLLRKMVRDTSNSPSSPSVFTCSKLTIETLEQGNMFKVNKNDTRITISPYFTYWTYFTSCSSVSFLNFEHVIS